MVGLPNDNHSQKARNHSREAWQRTGTLSTSWDGSSGVSSGPTSEIAIHDRSHNLWHRTELTIGAGEVDSIDKGTITECSLLTAPIGEYDGRAVTFTPIRHVFSQ
ncbi:unnamed protein product [Nezara viridula]|uniref:Uncharacterized protein n=1 Tax=Nezara viridula TaxID=85310 RepID=A0A9P0MIL2_NEZVI|nr:unnamed protein product [Nezara viridula]